VSDREFVLEQIRKSMRLHGTRRVILMVHSDCGAYGGLASGFGGDARAEAAHHQRELARAAANLLKAIPGMEVQGHFVDFEGIWDAELTILRPLEERPVAWTPVVESVSLQPFVGDRAGKFLSPSVRKRAVRGQGLEVNF
jgi:hypothetical protein